MAFRPGLLSRALVGEPLRQRPARRDAAAKRLALPVFCSDPLSSVAYATEQIVLVLGLGGLALLHLTPWLAAAVVVLLVDRRRLLPADVLRLSRTAAAPTRSAATTSARTPRSSRPPRC